MAHHSSADSASLPPRRGSAVQTLTEPFVRFLHVEAASGLVLLVAAIAALVWANSPWAASYHRVLEVPLGLSFGAFHLELTVHEIINEGLMTLFFFVVGLEIKRELVAGELRDPRSAMLPIAAALGGMIVPAAIYFTMQAGTDNARGWGIPMATDIAFAVGFLALLGSRVPRGLRVFLLALAIVDDLGAVLVIALFYTESLALIPLILGLAGMAIIFLMNRAGVRSIPLYFAVGVPIWFAFLESGVHPTVAGVILGFLTPLAAWLPDEHVLEKVRYWSKKAEEGIREGSNTPARREALENLAAAHRDAVSPLSQLEAALHPWVAFLIMPVFALANAGVQVSSSFVSDGAALSIALAVATGLFFGKPIGIFLFSFLATRIGLARLPEGVRWTSLAAAGVLAGIGFTVALFIATLAFPDAARLDAAKLGVLAGSIPAAVCGLALLWLSLRR